MLVVCIVVSVSTSSVVVTVVVVVMLLVRVAMKALVCDNADAFVRRRFAPPGRKH